MESLSTPRSTAGAHDATPTTDFALIESQKENIRPLASGRSAATLGSLVERTEREKVIQEGHERHQKEIEDAERRDAQGGEMAEGIQDVLDVYNRCVSSFETEVFRCWLIINIGISCLPCSIIHLPPDTSYRCLNRPRDGLSTTLDTHKMFVISNFGSCIRDTLNDARKSGRFSSRGMSARDMLYSTKSGLQPQKA